MLKNISKNKYQSCQIILNVVLTGLMTMYCTTFKIMACKRFFVLLND
jgi:hypothetical protein